MLHPKVSAPLHRLASQWAPSRGWDGVFPDLMWYFQFCVKGNLRSACSEISQDRKLERSINNHKLSHKELLHQIPVHYLDCNTKSESPRLKGVEERWRIADWWIGRVGVSQKASGSFDPCLTHRFLIISHGPMKWSQSILVHFKELFHSVL